MEGQLGKKSKKFLKGVIIKKTWDTLCFNKIYQVGKWAHQDIQVTWCAAPTSALSTESSSGFLGSPTARGVEHAWRELCLIRRRGSEARKQTSTLKNTTSLTVQWLRICLPMQGTSSSILGPEGSHMPWSNQAQEQQLLSLHSRTSDQSNRSHHSEKPTHCNYRVAPACHN